MYVSLLWDTHSSRETDTSRRDEHYTVTIIVLNRIKSPPDAALDESIKCRLPSASTGQAGLLLQGGGAAGAPA